MRSYYHCVTKKYRRRASVVILLSATIAAETAAIAFFVLFFNAFGTPSESLIYQMLMVAAVSVSAGTALSFAAAVSAELSVKNHSRYTYLDVQLKAVVYSRYSRSYTAAGERYVLRELYYIPLRSFTGASVSPDGRKTVITGEMRKFLLSSDNLGYHVKNGDIEFDRWWLNSGGFEKTERLVIPALFCSPRRLCEVFDEAKKRFDEIPPPKKYVFKEAEFIRRRRIRRVLPDNPDYSRKWKS